MVLLVVSMMETVNSPLFILIVSIGIIASSEKRPRGRFSLFISVANRTTLFKLPEYVRERPIVLRNAAANRGCKPLVWATAVVA